MDNTVCLRSKSHGHSFQLISFVVQELLLMYCLCAGFISPQDGNVTCTVPAVEEFQDATLTCNFPEDLNITKRDFSVFHKPTRPDSEAKIECWWISGKMGCSAKSGIKYHASVSRNFHITVLNVTSVVTGPYSCQLDNYDPNLFQTCELEMKKRLDSPQDADHFVKGLAIGVPLALVILGLAVTLIVLRQKIAVRLKCPRGQRKEHPEEVHELMETITESELGSVGKSFQEHLANKVSEMYPNLPDPFHFVPPVYFNRTRYRPQTVAYQLVYVPDPPDPSDVRHDRSMQHVIHCLRHMAESEKETMFVLTQFQYEDYLNSPDPAYRHHRLPMPAGLRKADSDVGCFDFLIVHRLHGLLVGVMKAVSDRDVESQDNELNEGHMIVQEVTEAEQQLKKAKLMIQHLMSDQEYVPNVRQTLIFPNLTRSSFRHAVGNHVKLVEKLRKCLGANAIDDPTELCLFGEQLSDRNTPWDVSHTVVKNLQLWWTRNMTSAENATMATELFSNIVARFFGPATKSYLRVPDGCERFALPKTLADAVSLTGDLYGRTMITPKNMELLDKPICFLVGKPNTGKTRMMTLVGSKWLASGHDVVVVNRSSPKADAFLSQRLKFLKTASNTQSTAEAPNGNVFDEECDFKSQKSIQKTIENIKRIKVTHKQILILLDAAQPEGVHIEEFCEKLDEQVKDLRLWASCTGRSCPAVGYGKLCTEFKNCPPTVVREAARHEADSDKRADTKGAPDYLPPTDGLPVKHIYHAGHPARSPQECQECGVNTGSFIADTLIKAASKGSIDTQESAVENQTGEQNMEQTTLDRKNVSKQTAQRGSLNFRDIMIVFEFNKTFGKPDITEDNSFVRALNNAVGINVQVINTDRPNVVAVNKSGDSDTAKVLHVRHMQTYKTKRKIVVYVEDESRYEDDENKLRALTSCTSQLILVHARQQ